jgi:hypothetical protein
MKHPKIQMNKRIGLIWFRFLGFKGLKNIKSVSLIELLISIMVLAIMVLSFQSLETYGHTQVMSADRRTKVQNSLAYCLEHMSKYVQQASGNKNYPPIKLYPDTPPYTGFQVRFDCGAPWATGNALTPQTPSDLNDDVWIYYTLNSLTHELIVGCSGLNCGKCSPEHLVPVNPESLSKKIVANFNNSVLPVSPTDGFYVVVNADPLVGNFVDVGLVGRYYPDQDPTATTRLTNPQVAIKTRLNCNNSSTN